MDGRILLKGVVSGALLGYMSTYLLRAKRIYAFILLAWFMEVLSSALGVCVAVSPRWSRCTIMETMVVTHYGTWRTHMTVMFPALKSTP